MSLRNTRGGLNVNIRNGVGEVSKNVKFKNRDYIDMFPFDDWTMASGRVKMTTRGGFEYFDTDIRTSDPRWRSCPYPNPTENELQDKKVRKIVRDWYKNCEGIDKVYTP